MREMLDVPGIKQFFALVDLLEMNDLALGGLLGGVTPGKLRHWRNLPSLRITTIAKHRMDHFLRITDGATRLLNGQEGALRWFRTASGHPVLSGHTPLEFLTKDSTGEGFEFLSRWIGSAETNS
jgi:hypothetical protein